MADGGEGTCDTLVAALGGKKLKLTVHDPLMRPIQAAYGILSDGLTAVIEIAVASGLPLLLQEEQNPMQTSTYGTGEMIKDALLRGCRESLIRKRQGQSLFRIGGSFRSFCPFLAKTTRLFLP